MITAETYSETAQAFLKARRDAKKPAGAVIALFPGKKGGVEFDAQIGPWGAWRAYWKRIGHKGMVRWMDVAAAAKESAKDFCLTVPMLWPHEFDMETATVQDDHEIAEAFRRNYRPPKVHLADAAQRAATVAAYKASIPKEARRGSWSPEQEAPKARFIDEEALMAAYEKDMAALNARKQRKQEAAE